MAEYDDTIVHEADGIQELDNKLPRWWVLLFQISIVFAVVYLMVVHVMEITPGSREQYVRSVAAAEAALAAREASAAGPVDYTVPSLDTTVLGEGQSLYETHCISCHKVNAGGLIGPNLTDAYWLHGATFGDNMTVIANGVLEKGMQAWKTMLSQRQRYSVASYIYSLRGSTPDAPKAPEGEEVAGSDDPHYNL